MIDVCSVGGVITTEHSSTIVILTRIRRFLCITELTPPGYLPSLEERHVSKISSARQRSGINQNIRLGFSEPSKIQERSLTDLIRAHVDTPDTGEPMHSFDANRRR